MKKSLIYIFLWSLLECFTGALVDNSSLAFSNLNERILVITLYLIPDCPHAQEILPQLEAWIELHDIELWQQRLATAYYPSPTLRIDYQEYGVNYIGKNEILAFI